MGALRLRWHLHRQIAQRSASRCENRIGDRWRDNGCCRIAKANGRLVIGQPAGAKAAVGDDLAFGIKADRHRLHRW